MTKKTRIEILKSHRELFSMFPTYDPIQVEDNIITFSHKKIVMGSVTRAIKQSFINKLYELGLKVTDHDVLEKIHLRGKVTYFTFHIRANDINQRVTRPSMRTLLGLVND